MCWRFLKIGAPTLICSEPPSLKNQGKWGTKRLSFQEFNRKLRNRQGIRMFSNQDTDKAFRFTDENPCFKN